MSTDGNILPLYNGSTDQGELIEGTLYRLTDTQFKAAAELIQSAVMSESVRLRIKIPRAILNDKPIGDWEIIVRRTREPKEEVG